MKEAIMGSRLPIGHRWLNYNILQRLALATLGVDKAPFGSDTKGVSRTPNTCFSIPTTDERKGVRTER